MIRHLLVRIGVLLSCMFSTALFAQQPDFGLDFDSILTAPTEAEEKLGVWSKLQLSGYLKNETAYRVREPRSITKIRNIAYLSADYPYNDFLDIRFS